VHENSLNLPFKESQRLLNDITLDIIELADGYEFSTTPMPDALTNCLGYVKQNSEALVSDDLSDFLTTMVIHPSFIAFHPSDLFETKLRERDSILKNSVTQQEHTNRMCNLRDQYKAIIEQLNIGWRVGVTDLFKVVSGISKAL
jgi:hypothetical protein